MCELADGKVVYAVPGVPYEMKQMVTDHVIPDLLRRSGEAAAIVSSSLKTWGTSESALAEMVAHRLDALDAQGGNPTIAFLARGIEGLVVRVTAKASDREPKRGPSSTSRRRNSGSFSATSCSASTTRRWSTRYSNGYAGTVGASGSRNR